MVNVKTAERTLHIRRMSLRKVQLSPSPKGRVLLTLWSRGVTKLTTTGQLIIGSNRRKVNFVLATN